MRAILWRTVLLTHVGGTPVAGPVVSRPAVRGGVLPPPASQSSAWPWEVGKFTLNGKAPSFRYDGHGAVSARAAGRLLYDYPEPQRTEILDLLFKPKFAASLHLLKVEIGGDVQSGHGTEPSHMHRASDLSCDRGHQLWLLAEARKRNPGLVIYALTWGMPGWVGVDPLKGGLFSKESIDYLVAWLGCCDERGIGHIDYLGHRSGRPWAPGASAGGSLPEVARRMGVGKFAATVGTDVAPNGTWTVNLRAALDAAGYNETRLIVSDGAWDSSVLAAAAASDVLAAALTGGAVGVHYPCFAPRPEIHAAGLAYWSAEDAGAPSDWGGASCLGRVLNTNFINQNITSTVARTLVWSVHPSLSDSTRSDGLIDAFEPWSGRYTVRESLWALAHTTQFVEVGWRILGVYEGFGGQLGSSGRLPKGGTYVTYKSPDNGHFTLVVEKLQGKCPRCFGGSRTVKETLTFFLTGGLQQLLDPIDPRLRVRVSNGTCRFYEEERVLVDNSDNETWSFSLVVQPDSIYTVSTTSGQYRGGPPTPMPTRLPTMGPTSAPSAVPTLYPTSMPTSSPTPLPTSTPTLLPSLSPTSYPTAAPTPPTSAPSEAPTAPTDSPTWSWPTIMPTDFPTPTTPTAPTNSPTNLPTMNPTSEPTMFPSSAPTSLPTLSPSSAPTSSPTLAPTSQPTSLPSQVPTGTPTAAPTHAPTGFPTSAPTSLWPCLFEQPGHHVGAGLPFPLPHFENFESYDVGSTARYFVDYAGSWQADKDTTLNKVLRQWAAQSPGANQWGPEVDPLTFVGVGFQDAAVSAVLLLPAASARLAPASGAGPPLSGLQSAWTRTCLATAAGAAWEGAPVIQEACAPNRGLSFRYDTGNGFLAASMRLSWPAEATVATPVPLSSTGAPGGGVPQACLAAKGCLESQVCLMPCGDGEGQGWIWGEDGTLRLRARPDMCLTLERHAKEPHVHECSSAAHMLDNTDSRQQWLASGSRLAAHAGACTRLQAPDVGATGRHRRGYCLTLGVDIHGRGVWRLERDGVVLLTQGPLIAAVGAWHSLRLEVKGSQLTAVVDGQVVGMADDNAYGIGMAGLSSGWHETLFDDVSIDVLLPAEQDPLASGGADSAAWYACKTAAIANESTL